MEPVLKSFLYCDSIVPAPDGKLNLYGLFTDLYAQQFPITYPKFSVLSTWGDGLGFHVQRIKVVNPANTMVLHQSGLKVEHVKVAGCTRHEELDDTLGFWWMVDSA